MTPMVSVVIPTFNRGALVVRAIESVLRQTYTAYEIIIIDDGSTDDTPSIIAPYFDRIRYHRQDNRGSSAARNAGIAMAAGEWIALLDSDDIWLPRKLETQMETVAEMGADCGVCLTSATLVGKPEGARTLFEEGGFVSSLKSGLLDMPVRYVLGRFPILHTSSMLIRRCIIEGENGFDTEIVVTEDTDLFFRLSLKTKFCFVNVPLVDILWFTPINSGRLSQELSGKKSDRLFRSQAHMYNKWLRLLELQGNMELTHRILDSLKLLYYEWLITKLREFRWSDAWLLSKHIMKVGDGLCEICAVLCARGLKRALRCS